MIVQMLVFYLFSAVTVAAGVMVISARNPVHSVLFLILAFFNSAGLFVLIGAEFLAMVLVIVYVGAVAVLFLFVVMMLDINFVRMREGFLQYLPIGGLVGLILLVELVLVAASWTFGQEQAVLTEQPITPSITNTEALGDLLYTDYFYLFQAVGFILLVAMISAITLTLRRRPDTRRQSIAEQVHRLQSVELRKISPGGGV
ncbi:MAG TPA: NADH-quinone oxidoreductase subunit J [Geminicoccaceae bacterium]|nr:NADH-quinone oxidoreductase subunit J [Geminicoccaceae bacterium]